MNNPSHPVPSIQQSVSDKKHAADWILVILCGLFIFSFAVLYYILPDSSFSNLENTSLQTRPKFSAAILTSQTFSDELEDFYTDQLPLRSFWLSFKAGFELGLAKEENNSVFLCRDGYLIKRLEYNDFTILNQNLNGISALQEAMNSSGIPLTVAIAPRGIDVLQEYLPDWYDTAYSETVWDEIDASGISYLSFQEMLKGASAEKSVWYKTDHHWSTDGAYLAYLQIAEKLGISPKSLSSFTRETATSTFYGTTYASSGMYWKSPDEIVLYRYDGDDSYTVSFDGLNSMTGFYDWEALNGSSPYEVFFGGNYGHMSIYLDDSKPTLLVLKDSFANSVFPFLAIDYNIEVIDPRYYKGTIASFINTHDIDQILILYGVDSLATGSTLSQLSVSY